MVQLAAVVDSVPASDGPAKAYVGVPAIVSDGAVQAEGPVPFFLYGRANIRAPHSWRRDEDTDDVGAAGDGCFMLAL